MSESQKGKKLPSDTRLKVSESLIGNDNGLGKPVPSRWHPNRESARKFFFSLPAYMPLSKKRRILSEKYPKPNYKTVWRWTTEWCKEKPNSGHLGKTRSSEILLKMSKAQKGKQQHPQKSNIHAYFLTLPSTLSLSEKRKKLREKYPNVVSNTTICKWTKSWTEQD